MGWCHEFGSQIRHGCDHPMVAGTDSCSCPGCGVVCLGKFSSCDLVWERGPRQVTLVRAVHEAPAMALRDDGQLALNPVRPEDRAPAPGTGAPVPIEWTKILDGLQSDLRVMSTALERQGEVLERQGESMAARNGQAQTLRLSELVESLPERIGMAVSRALAQPVPDSSRSAAAPPSAAPPVAPAPPAAAPPLAPAPPASPLRPAAGGPAPGAGPIPAQRASPYGNDEWPPRPAPSAHAVAPVPPAGGVTRGPAATRGPHHDPAPAEPFAAPEPARKATAGGLHGWEALRVRLSAWAGKPTGTD